MTPFSVGHVVIGPEKPTLIAGPCLAESTELCLRIAERVMGVADRFGLGYVFKASFDKANRSSGDSVRGAGLEEGLKILTTVKEKLGLPVTTDVHLPDQCAAVAQAVDLLQIPAFLCRQTDLLEAAAATGKPVNVKKGQFLAPEDTQNIVRKLEAAQANGIMLTERGTTFGYHALIVDFPGLETMRGFGHPVCFDATHSAQRPGGMGTSTGGVRASIPAMVRAAAAVGVDALFLETHPEPANASSDRETQWALDDIESVLRSFVEIGAVARSSRPA